MKSNTSREIKEMSRLTKQEWREYTKTIWRIANIKHTAHPAVFPAEIPHRLIKMFTFVGETVLDPFAGTGTSAVAALMNGRGAICIEQSGDYVKIIRKNLRKAKSEMASDLFHQESPPFLANLKISV